MCSPAGRVHTVGDQTAAAAYEESIMKSIKRFVLFFALALSLGLGAASAFAQQQGADDTAILINVKAALDSDVKLAGTHIEATSKDGVVVLYGAVESEQQSREAFRVATSVTGVHQVKAGALIVMGPAAA
jgi:hypothetical protein